MERKMSTHEIKNCWENNNCPPDQREKCYVFNHDCGELCDFLKNENTHSKTFMCEKMYCTTCSWYKKNHQI